MTETQKKALTCLLVAVACFISVGVVNFVGKPNILQPGMDSYQQAELAVNIVMISDFFIGLGFLIAAIIYYKRIK